MNGILLRLKIDPAAVQSPRGSNALQAVQALSAASLKTYKKVQSIYLSVSWTMLLRSGANQGRQPCKQLNKQATTACQAGCMGHANIRLYTK